MKEIVDDTSVCVVGMGYIGLPTAALIASSGHQVIGVDTNTSLIRDLNRGEVHISEPGLAKVIEAALHSGNLSFSNKIPNSVTVFIICVPTPLITEEGQNRADLSALYLALDNLVPNLQHRSLVIIESTCPVGTTRKVSEYMATRGLDPKQIDLAYCPERVIPGSIMNELRLNDRLVGGIDEKSTARAVELYRSFVDGVVSGTTAETAELCKLAENSYRDINIAFANELSMICEQCDVSWKELVQLANRHPRVNILSPGPGVGGHCIAIDPWFICEQFPDLSALIRQARLTNEFKKTWTLKKIIERVSGENTNTFQVCLLGLTYKADVDDIRESPSIWIARELISRGFKVVAVDPFIERLSDIELVNLSEATLDKSELLVGLVAHSQFVGLVSSDNWPREKYLDFCGLL